MTSFSTWNIPTQFLVQCLLFPVSTIEKCFGRILTTFSGLVSPKQDKLVTGPGLPDFAIQTYSYYLGCTLYRLSSLQWKMFRLNFIDFLRPEHCQSKQSWKSGSDDFVLHPKHTHTVCGAVFIVSCQYGWKMFRLNFDDFSGPGSTGAGKVENRA